MPRRKRTARRKERLADELRGLTDEELSLLRDPTGRPYALRKPPLPGFEEPDATWLAWGREMKRRGLSFAALSSFETEAETASRWAARLEVPGGD